MPIFTAGLAAIPPRYASSGSTSNNIAQRISGSIGVAGLTVLVTSQQDQFMADRSALMPASSPELAQWASQGTSAVYSLYQQVQIQALASAYAEAFTVVAWLTMIGVFLALMLRKPGAHEPAPDIEATAAASADVNGHRSPAAPAAGGSDTDRVAEPSRG